MSEDKVQKLTEALYRVTELFPDKEPLKWQLRDNAVEILDFMLLVENKEVFNTGNIFDLFRKMNYLLQLASSSSAFISKINFEVLRREYLILVEEINKMQVPKEITSPKDLLVISNGQSVISNGHSNGHDGQPNGHNGQKENKEKNKEQIDLIDLLDKRKKQILTVIKPNEWKTIQEIAGSLPGISIKNIQRVLLDMVENGILRKEGDKRWRKYSLS
jgi:hypothetical protein